MKVLVSINKEVEIEVSNRYSPLLKKYDEVLVNEMLSDIEKNKEIDGLVYCVAEADDPWNVLWEN